MHCNAWKERKEKGRKEEPDACIEEILDLGYQRCLGVHYERLLQIKALGMSQVDYSISVHIWKCHRMIKVAQQENR